MPGEIRKGLGAACSRCHGAMRATGNEKMRTVPHSFGAEVDKIKAVECRCETCGHLEWTDVGDAK